MLVQATTKSGSKIPLILQKAILVRINDIPHTFNPCGDVTTSYILWEGGGRVIWDLVKLSEDTIEAGT